MKQREHNRNRFLNKKNIAISGGILTVLAKIIYSDLKNENSIIKNIFRKITGTNKIINENNITDITDSAEIVESENKKKISGE